MNSALQCLSHSYDLNNFLKLGTFKKKLNKKAESLILLEWNKLRELIWSENCIISPGGFLSSVQKVAKIKDKTLFTGFAQNDLIEFLTFVIDCFHTAIFREVDMKITGETITETDKLAKSCFGMMKNMYKKEYSELLNIFYGIHVSKISTPENEYLSSAPEPFLTLDLPLPMESQRNNKTCSILECLDQYTKVEVLDGDNKYETDAGNKVVAHKQILFWSLPEVLIISIKRFSNAIKKNQSLVNFPLAGLDMSKYVVGYDKESYVYDLYGICNHGGSVFGGHYTAAIKNANGKWYSFNDQQISEIADQNKLVSPKAYCFFYRKKK
jgi:ubiquitin carboxyl-terminal hydrolase 8